VTGATDQFTTFAGQGQDALAGAARTWAESVQRLSSALGTPAADPTALVDIAFDLAEQVLATQRELTKAVLRAVTP
jgi:hypothetical protein